MDVHRVMWMTSTTDKPQKVVKLSEILPPDLFSLGLRANTHTKAWVAGCFLDEIAPVALRSIDGISRW